MTQADLDRAIGRARGTTAQIEAGRVRPPDLETSTLYEDALNLNPGGLWNEAAAARLEDYDAELYQWHREVVQDATGFEATDEEIRIIALVRQLASEKGHVADLPKSLADVLEAITAPGALPPQVWHNPTLPFARIVRRLRGMPYRDQHALWVVFDELVKQWEARHGS